MAAYPRSYRGMYNYQRPTVRQYESFFNPVPIEFIQEQLRGRQQQYDAAYAGALAGRDEFANIQVGMADLASKNQLISKGMDNINRMVEEKYGGDWGRAAKEVARNVSQMRSDPFWNAQKEMEKRRQAFQEDISKYGSKAMIFGADPRQMSTIDPATGQVRDISQLTGRVVEQGDWAKTAQTLMSGLSADVYQNFGLTEGELQGYISGTKRTEITRKKIEKMASDPAIQQAFLREHPEFREAFEQGDDQMRQRFGFQNYDTINAAVKDQLLGASASAETSRLERSLMADWRQKLSAETAAKNKSIGAFGPINELEATATGYGTSKQEMREIKGKYFFNNALSDSFTPSYATPTETKLRNQAMDILTPKEKEMIQALQGVIPPELQEKVRVEQDRLLKENKAIIDEERQNDPSYMKDKSEYDELKSSLNEIKRLNPALTKDKSDWEIYEDFLTDTEGKYRYSIDLSLPVLDEATSVNMGRSINFNNTEWYLDSGMFNTNNWHGRKGIGEEVNIPAETMAELLRDGNIPIHYNMTRGNFFLEVPVVRGEIKKNQDGSINWKDTKSDEKKRVYFTPDLETRGVNKLLMNADKIVKDKGSREELIASLPQTIVFDETMIDSGENENKDINNQEVFKMINDLGKEDYYSLNELRAYYAGKVNKHISSTYGKFE